MEELWKDISEYGGVYQVSNLGRIAVMRNSKRKIMKQRQSKDKYVRILLFKDRRYKSEYVHILVAKAFVDGYASGLEVNHIDANKGNNVASNLEWVTRSENHFHAVRMGLKPVCPTIGKYGSKNPLSKPILQIALDGTVIRKWDCRSDAAESLGTTPNSISRCILGHRRTCKGYIWKNA